MYIISIYILKYIGNINKLHVDESNNSYIIDQDNNRICNQKQMCYNNNINLVSKINKVNKNQLINCDNQLVDYRNCKKYDNRIDFIKENINTINKSNNNIKGNNVISETSEILHDDEEKMDILITDTGYKREINVDNSGYEHDICCEHHADV